MTICPNCSHRNPSGATQCEACFTPLPATSTCPSCGATVQLDATFCGQCGTSLKATTTPSSNPSTAAESALPATIIAGAAASSPDLDPVLNHIPDPILPVATPVINSTPESTPTAPPVPISEPDLPAVVNSAPNPIVPPTIPDPVPVVVSSTPDPLPSVELPDPVSSPPPAASTQLQQQRFQLTHVQSGTVLEIPLDLSVVHIGKPNDQVPPDIDVSGFPCSEVVSRIHADIRIDGDSLYLEDISSANGTYVNHNALPKGNRHLLRVGDRISLGKGDLVTFLFQSV